MKAEEEGRSARLRLGQRTNVGEDAHEGVCKAGECNSMCAEARV